MRIYVAAPFGNYLKIKGTKPVIGTYTLNKRSGLLWKLLTTLRYNFRDECWYNSSGLRNPGINHGIEKYEIENMSQVLSVAAINPEDYDLLNKKIPVDIPLELNISCPNITHFADYLKGLTQFLPRNPILKLSPHMHQQVLDFLLDEGFTHFHASNTYKTHKGARSGKFLQPYTRDTISYLREKLKDKGRLIAGGGITSFRDIHYYTSAGADDVSLGTVCFHPFKLRKLLKTIL